MQLIHSTSELQTAQYYTVTIFTSLTRSTLTSRPWRS